MDLEEEFDFTVIADNIFPLDDRDVNFSFDVTWKDKSSKLIINCREISRKGNQNSGISKIKSFTIPEFEAVHNELCTIEPKIYPYFPNEFTFKVIEIERLNDTSSWSFFSISSKSIVEQEKDFSEETVLGIKNYLRAVAEICGQKLLFSIIFKEGNDKYFEDHETFIKNESKKKVVQCFEACIKLLDNHSNVENLQSLTEDLYIKEDDALNIYQESLFSDSLMISLPLVEEGENIREKLEKSLIDLQSVDIGPKKITELRSDAEKFMQEYYEIYKKILNNKIRVSKKQKELYLKYLCKMMEDKNKYQAVIFRDCVGERICRLSKSFHKENEKIAQLNLDLHATEDIVVMRKIELIRSWSIGQDMVRGNVRHEDVSLIQLKNLDSSNIDTSLLEEYYMYIKETYKLLLDYNESQRLSLENLKHIIDDPLSVVLPTSRRLKASSQIKSEEKEPLQSIDYSGVINLEFDSDFEDALDENEFGNLKKNEIEKFQMKSDCDEKLKEIANKRAELRNSKAKLESQHEKLVNKVSETLKRNYESLHLESLHPEIDNIEKRSVPGTSLTPEQRKEEAKKVRERIKKYQEKLRAIPENKIMNSIKPKRNTSGKPKNSANSGSLNLSKSQKPQIILDIETDQQLKLPPPPSQPPPPLPPHPPPPPPPPSAPPLIVLPAPTISNQFSKSKVKEKEQQKNTSYLDELQMAFVKRKIAKTSNAIDDEILSNKVTQRKTQFVDNLSNMVDNRRRYFNSEADDSL